jgi:steroid 5-alpha reductase family enzyme
MQMMPWGISQADQLLALWLFMGGVMTLGWVWQRHHVNAGIVDVLWAFGLACAAVWLAAAGTGAPTARLLVGVLGTVWGLRLALHLWVRVRREPEDGRYRALREHWQGRQWKFFAFFQLQALLVVLFALPWLAVAGHPAPAAWQLGLALGVWIVAVAGETLADTQLARFRADPGNRGKTCRSGLWRYSRHPNYFFEWLHWCSYAIAAIGAPRAWLGLLGPVAMYLFLRFISGIPFTEQQALRSRGEDYRDYQRRTPMLFPWFPRD